MVVVSIRTHFIPDGNPAPPRPRRPEALISEISYHMRISICTEKPDVHVDGPSHDLSILSPWSYTSRHTSSHSSNQRHGVRTDFGISCPGLSIRQSVFS